MTMEVVSSGKDVGHCMFSLSLSLAAYLSLPLPLYEVSLWFASKFTWIGEVYSVAFFFFFFFKKIAAVGGAPEIKKCL